MNGKGEPEIFAFSFLDLQQCRLVDTYPALLGFVSFPHYCFHCNNFYVYFLDALLSFMGHSYNGEGLLGVHTRSLSRNRSIPHPNLC